MIFDPAGDETAFARRRDELVTEFETWVRASRSGVDVSLASGDASTLFDWKFGYEDGDLSRWLTADLYGFLIEWCPRKVSGPAELLATIPEHVGLVMEFLGSTGLLSRNSHTPQALSEYAVGLQQDFQTQMASPANFGMAKSIFASLGVDDPTSLDPGQLEQLIGQFNALPLDQRKAITDPAMQQSFQRPYLGTIQLPEPDELLAAAMSAPLLTVFDRLADHFATGRTLTKTGALTVADARALAELLETGEEPVVENGQHSHRRRTAQNYPEVGLWVEWASAAGVLRKHRGKLVVVAKWTHRRRTDVVATVVAAAVQLVQAGPLGLSQRYYLRNDRLVDDHVFVILLRAAQSAEQQFADVLAILTEAAESEASEHYPGHLVTALDQALTRLAQAGVITQTGVETEQGDYGFWQRRATGSFRITALGLVVVSQLADDSGADLVRLAPPSQLSVDDLVALADHVESSEVWWSNVTGFLDVQPSVDEVTDRVAELIVGLSVVSPLTTSVILANVPADELDRWEPGLRRLAAGEMTHGTDVEETVRLLALHGLDLHGLAEPDTPADQLLRAGLVTAGLICADSGATFAADLATQDNADETAAELIADVSRLLPPYALELLTALGTHYPQKRIAKAARKELFRVRSKLAAAGRAH